MNPLLSSGIMPSAGASLNQLESVTRRAFIPMLIDQQSSTSPLYAMLLANHQTASGGLNSITLPVQMGDMVTAQASDYSGTFNLPSDTATIQNAMWNLKMTVVPIGLSFTESIIQDDYSIVKLMSARMNNAGNVMRNFMNQALLNNTANSSNLIGLPAAIDDGTLSPDQYAGISRSLNPSWKSYYRAVPSGTNLTRMECMKHIVNVMKGQNIGGQQVGGEAPNCGFVGAGTWLSLASDFVGQEVFQNTPTASFDGEGMGPRSGFKAIRVAGIPIFMDINVADGDLWLLNSNYLNLYVHERISYFLSPFESLTPNGQLGYVGAVLNLSELVNAKPSTSGHVTGLNVLS